METLPNVSTLHLLFAGVKGKSYPPGKSYLGNDFQDVFQFTIRNYVPWVYEIQNLCKTMT